MNKYFNSGNISFVGLNRLTNSIKTLQEKLVVDSCDQTSGEILDDCCNVSTYYLMRASVLLGSSLLISNSTFSDYFLNKIC